MYICIIHFSEHPVSGRFGHVYPHLPLSKFPEDVWNYSSSND